MKGKFEANGEKKAKNIWKGREKVIEVDWTEEYLIREDIMVINQEMVVINIKKEMEEIMIMIVSDQDLREIIRIMSINDQNKVEIITVNLLIRKGIVIEGVNLLFVENRHVNHNCFLENSSDE